MSEVVIIDLDQAAALWADGLSAMEIAERLGCSRRYLYNFAEHHREHFPVRQEKKKIQHYVGTRHPTPPRIRPERQLKPLPPDQIRRITISGAIVTLPRIPTIDGYADVGEALQAAE